MNSLPSSPPHLPAPSLLPPYHRPSLQGAGNSKVPSAQRPEKSVQSPAAAELKAMELCWGLSTEDAETSW